MTLNIFRNLCIGILIVYKILTDEFVRKRFMSNLTLHSVIVAVFIMGGLVGLGISYKLKEKSCCERIKRFHKLEIQCGSMEHTKYVVCNGEDIIDHYTINFIYNPNTLEAKCVVRDLDSDKEYNVNNCKFANHL